MNIAVPTKERINVFALIVLIIFSFQFGFFGPVLSWISLLTITPPKKAFSA